MGDEPARRFLCARCRAPALVCSRCDRGQIYCATGCAAVVPQQSQRDAGRRYQCSRPGRFMHAARTQRWRERQAWLAVPLAGSEMATPQSVTHQGSALPTSDAVLVTVPSPVAAAAVPDVVHTFATVLGLMLVSLARIALAPDASAKKLLESLSGIKATLVRITTGGPGRRPTVMLAPELTAEQRCAVKVFELGKWFPDILSCTTSRPLKA